MLLCYPYTETSHDIVLLPVVLYAFPRIVGVFGTGHHFPFTFFIITKPVGCYCYDKNIVYTMNSMLMKLKETLNPGIDIPPDHKTMYEQQVKTQGWQTSP